MGAKENIVEMIPALRAYAWVLTRRHEDVDDLVQDTLERAIRKRRLWERRGSLRGWLYRILYNLFLNQTPHRRRRRAELDLEAAPTLSESPTHDDRLELVTPKQTRKIPITAIRTLDLSLTASEMDEEKSLDHSQRREQILRGIAEAMLMGTPAGDLLVKISESRLIDPQPRLLLLGPDPQAWSIDRTTVFPDLAAQGAAQSLANLLRFSGILIGSLAAHRTTPETRALWQEGDLSGIRRDSLEEQQARIEALHAWIQDGGSLGPVTDSQ